MTQAETGRNFNRFAPSAKGVLIRAKKEAKGFNHNYIGTEHLLLGILTAPEFDPAKQILNKLGITANQARSAVEFIVGRCDGILPQEAHYSLRTQKAIELAGRTVHGHYFPNLNSLHLLLGVVWGEEGIGVGILESMGISPEKVRQEVERIIERESP